MILVAGATGSLGRLIVRGLLERGDAVRVLARPSSDYALLQQAGATVALGDMTDPDSLARACEGASAVLTTASVSKTGTDSIEHVDLQGNLNLIDAARTAGVGHFVFTSTLRASVDSPVPLFRAKGAAEQRLRESGMAWTVLKANAFMDVWFPMFVERPMLAGEPVTLVGESRGRHSFVAERDVAAFAVAALTHAAARNSAIDIGGPEALTFTDVVRAYEEGAGRPIPVRRVAPGDPIPGVPPPIWGMAAGLEQFDSVVPMDEASRRYGVTLTSVRDFVRGRLTAHAS